MGVNSNRYSRDNMKSHNIQIVFSLNDLIKVHESRRL